MDMVAVEPAGQFSGHLIAFATMLVAFAFFHTTHNFAILVQTIRRVLMSFRFFEITNADGTFCPTVVCVLMQLTNQLTTLLSIAGILMPVLCYFR